MVYKLKIFILLLLALAFLTACGGNEKVTPEKPATPEPVTEPETPEPGEESEDPTPGQEPEPTTPKPPEVLTEGILKLEFSEDSVGDTVVVTTANGASVSAVTKSFTQFQTADAHYLSLKLELLCATCEAKLALVAAAAPSSVASSAFSGFKLGTSQLDTSTAEKTARALLPVHGMRLEADVLSVIAEEASFQVFDALSLSDWQSAAPENHQLLPYGFSVSELSETVGSLGLVTLAFKLPRAVSQTVPAFSIYLRPDFYTQAQVTESLEEQGDMQAIQRAELSQAKVMVLANSPTKADARFCSVRLNYESEASYLINEPNCRPVDTVDNFVDEQDGDFSKGNLSLREALTRAHEGTLIKFSTADTILLNASLGSLDLSASASLDASEHAQPIMLDAQSAIPILEISPDINAYLSNIHFLNGNSEETGGAFSIPKGTQLNLNNTYFISNTAKQDGAAIFNEGTLELEQTSFSKNFSKEDGGAVANFGELTAHQSYFFKNVAMGAGGAIFNASTAQTTITNSQISSNQADYGGGLFHRYGKLGLSFNSIYANHAIRDGGGLYTNTTSSQIELHANLIAGNRDAAQNLAQDVFVNGSTNPFQSSYNFIGLIDNENYLLPETNANQNNQVGLSLKTYLNPVVAWQEETIAASEIMPLPESPLRNAIPLGVLGCGQSLGKDIKHKDRPINNACDIGAYEAN